MTIWKPGLTAGGGPRYLALARAIEGAIATGELRPGDRLPTHRELADTLAVTVGTVTRAYAEARARGLIHGEVGRGTFVQSRPGERRAGALPAQGAPISLDINRPPPFGELPLRDGLAALARLPPDELLAYGDPMGSPGSRAAGAAVLAMHDVQVAADDVAVCSGAQHGLLIALAAVCRPGDAVLVPALCYPGLGALVRMLGLRAVPVAHDGDGLLPAAVRAAARASSARVLYCSPTLHNPVPTVLPLERRRELVRIAARESLVIVEDDVHRLLVTRPPPPLAALDPERVVYVTSVSKILAGGLRVGYLTAPRVHRGRVQDALWATSWSTANLTAELVAHWQADGTLASAVRARRKEARARVRLALASLAGFDVAAHPESFHLWWRLPNGWPQARFVTEALRVGVAVSGADAFCVAPGGAAVEDAVRLSLSGPQTQAELSDGLSRLVRLATEPPERMRM